MIDAHQAAAQTSDARIVFSCERYIAWSTDARRVEDINTDIHRLLPELRHEAGPVVDTQPERVHECEAEMHAAAVGGPCEEAVPATSCPPQWPTAWPVQTVTHRCA